MHLIEIRNGELMNGIAQQAAELGIRDAAIVTLIGAADTFELSNVREHDATKNTVTTYDLPAEMTATGEIVDGIVHVHAVMATEGAPPVAGHLRRAEVRTHFARAYIESL